MTLIEVMAVTVLMAMVAAMAMVSLGAADGGARMLSAVARMKDLDFRGRLLARTSGEAARLAIDPEHNRIMLRQVGSDTLIADEHLSVTVVFNADHDRAIQSIQFDRFGHSIDYAIVMRREGRTIKLNVRGLTGVIDQAEGSP